MVLKTLYQYSLVWRDGVSAAVGDHLFRLDLASAKFLVPKSVAYLTPDFIDDSARAQELLSISYAPSYRCKVVVNSPAELIDNQGLPWDWVRRLPRVWPAFGHVGGANEVLLIGKGQPLPCSVDTFDTGSTGGSTEAFHQDVVEPFMEDQLIQVLANPRVRALLTGEQREPDLALVKIVPSGVVVHWKANDLRYTLSLGYREEVAGTSVRMWGDIWREGYLEPGADGGYSARYPFGALREVANGPESLLIRYGWGPLTREVWLPFVTPHPRRNGKALGPKLSPMLTREVLKLLRDLLGTGTIVQKKQPHETSWSQPSNEPTP
jgi:hypothetical protein